MVDKADVPGMLGAVDLGSNSFHMIVARFDDGVLKVVDRMREPVRLAAGLGADGALSPSAQRVALDCLARFGQRLRHLPPRAVRVAGTNTLRAARNADAFLRAAEEALGHSIEVVAGVEEARLIYLGVAHSLADSGERRLVVDIGGGSTELILGERFTPLHMESLQMGCVAMTMSHFADGRIARKRWAEAELAARMELEPVERAFRRLRWDAAVGASGAVRAIGEVVNAAGWSDGGITLAALERLRDTLLKAGHAQALKLEGLNADRRPVFPAGVVILLAVFGMLGIRRMDVASGALRDGLLYDLIGRFQDDDIRVRSVGALAARFRVDHAQAGRVEATARRLLAAAAPAWELHDEHHARLLGWAAHLHELGIGIAHSQYHKHGAYVVEHADMAGFSRQEQRLLAALIRAHRRKFPPAIFEALPPRWRQSMAHLALLLRLAVLLHRGRDETPLPAIPLRAGGKSLHLMFEKGWLDQHALTRADLEQEAAYLAAAGYELKFSE